jgi:hypothetical protein
MSRYTVLADVAVHGCPAATAAVGGVVRGDVEVVDIHRPPRVVVEAVVDRTAEASADRHVDDEERRDLVVAGAGDVDVAAFLGAVDEEPHRRRRRAARAALELHRVLVIVAVVELVRPVVVH